MSDLRLLVTVPNLRRTYGFLTIDPVKAALGGDLPQIFAGIIDGPTTSRALPGGALVDVHPVRIPAGQSLAYPIPGMAGDLGFGNWNGMLLLTVPNAVAAHVARALAADLAAGDAAGPKIYGSEHGGINADFVLRPGPGKRWAIPLGGLGEVGVEGT